MAYIGNAAPSRFVSNRAASVYSGDGSTVAFTLEQVVTQDEDVLVSVDGVVQEPSVAYAVSNGTTLTFTAAPSSNSGNNIFVYYLASQTGTVGHPAAQNLSAGTGTFSGTLGVTGALSAKGGAVFNEDSADVDFRVESNASANALVVNGGTNRVGIGTDSPDHAIHVVASTDGTGVSGDDSFVAHFQNLEATADKSFGVKISAGSTGTDQALTIVDHDGTNSLYSMTGAGTSSQVANKASVYAMNVYHAGDNSNRYGIAIRTGSNDGGGTNYSIGFQRGAGNAVGSITHSGGSTSFNTSSDYRLKENVDYTFDATTRLKQLKPARFNFIGFSNTVDGFLAHEVSSVIPEAVVGAKDAVDADDNIEPQAIDQSKLVPLLVKTLQEALTEIDTLKTKVAALESA